LYCGTDIDCVSVPENAKENAMTRWVLGLIVIASLTAVQEAAPDQILVRNCSDFPKAEDSKVSFPLMKPIQRIVI